MDNNTVTSTADRAERREAAAEHRRSTHPDEARLSIVTTVLLSVFALVGGWSFASAVSV